MSVAAPVSARPQDPPAAGAGHDLTVPRPDLSAMEPAARARVESVQRGLEELLARPEPPRLDTGQAFGFLGQVLHALDRPRSAIDAYATARRLVPEDHRWTYYLGLAHQGIGELERAVEEYRRYLAAVGADGAADSAQGRTAVAAAHLRLGDALLQLARPQEAEEAYRAARSAGAEAAALHGLGRLAAQRGDAETAVRRFTEVLALQPEATAVHYPLAQALQRLGREQLATYHLALRGRQPEEREVTFPDPLRDDLATIGKSVALEVVGDLAADADVPEADFLGFALSQLGSSAAGVGEPMRQMIDYSRQQGAGEAALGRLHAALGVLLARAGDDEAAREALERALELDPSLVETRIHLGNALARAGRYADALERFDQVLARRPDAAAVLVQRGAVRANLGQLDEARRDLEAAVEADPTFAEAHLRLGSVLERLERRDAAAEAYRRSAELAASEPARAAAWTAAAGLARSRGRRDEAAAAYDRALDADPLHAPALEGLAGLLGEAGRYREAATLYRRLVEMRPDHRQARLGEVTALVAAGADRVARERLEAAVERFPDDLALKHVLARHLSAAADAAVRDGERAVELAEEVNRGLPNPGTMETLAMAYAEAGRFERAAEMQERLLAALGERLGQADRRRLEANLERYRRGEACCAGAGDL